jgi:hypothetical protein
MLPDTVLADLADAAEQLAQVRRQKDAAFAEGDMETAAALRDQERQLLAGRQVLDIIAENQRLRRELKRLRDLLRRHGIEPDGGAAARTA